VYQTSQATKTPAQLPVNPGDDCKVCGLTKLTFEPPCIYCTQCGQRIKRGQTYHCTALEPGCEFRGFWCHSCLSEHKSDRIPWEGAQVCCHGGCTRERARVCVCVCGGGGGGPGGLGGGPQARGPP
jgi:hypothetical protein